jgi:hypothetical protein
MATIFVAKIGKLELLLIEGYLFLGNDWIAISAADRG